MPDAPPPTRRDDLVEDLHGHHVADPYRWLEDGADPEVRAWVAAQAAHAASVLAELPARAAFRAALAALWDHPRHGPPWRRGRWWFQLRNDGLQDQDVLWCAASDAADPGASAPPLDRWRVLVDPNGWTDDGTASLSALAPTDDGELLAYARSDGGSDWLTWRVVEVATGTGRPDVVPWGKFSGAAWLPSGDAFLYAAYDPPPPGREHAAANRDQQLRRHRVGTDPADDVVVHARPDDPELGFSPHVSADGRWLVLTVWRGTDPTNRVHVAPLDGDRIGPVTRLLDRADARYDVAGVLDDRLVLSTDRGAPTGRVVEIDLDGTGELRELVPARDDRLEAVTLVGGEDGGPAWLVCRYLHHATARLRVHDARTGAHLHDLALPGPGTVAAVTGGRGDRAVHLTFESFTAPVTVLRAELPTGEVAPSPPPIGTGRPRPDTADGPPLVTEQVRVHHAGVAVPLFLVHRADVRPTGDVPTVLWGYGGFDIPVTPLHRPAWRAWVEAGGLLAVACLRGGGEYGRDWHDDGRLANKQHVFDDALACAAWLTGRRRDEVRASAPTDGTSPTAPEVTAVWTAPQHLGIEGRSNGGLLVGACLTQAPGAFGSAVPEVGVLDLVRFSRFTIGWAWTSDYGDPDDPDDLAVLLRYSPYHRVTPGTAYPPTLLTTADTDDRVVPLHSYKFAAALQHAQAGDAPVLLRVETSAGHGAGKPVGKLLDERADVLAFHAASLGLTVETRGPRRRRGPRAG